MQSKLQSLVEASISTLIGYVVAVLTQIIAYPYFNIHVDLGTQLGLGLIFTVVSLIRSYCVRRMFNHLAKDELK